MQGHAGIVYPLNMNDQLQRNSALSAYKTKKHYLNVDIHHNKNHDIFDYKFNGDASRGKPHHIRQNASQHPMLRYERNNIDQTFKTIQNRSSPNGRDSPGLDAM